MNYCRSGQVIFPRTVLVWPGLWQWLQSREAVFFFAGTLETEHSSRWKGLGQVRSAASGDEQKSPFFQKGIVDVQETFHMGNSGRHFVNRRLALSLYCTSAVCSYSFAKTIPGLVASNLKWWYCKMPGKVRKAVLKCADQLYHITQRSPFLKLHWGTFWPPVVEFWTTCSRSARVKTGVPWYSFLMSPKNWSGGKFCMPWKHEGKFVGFRPESTLHAK